MTSFDAEEIVLTQDASADLRALQEQKDKGSRSIVERVRALKPTLLSDCLHGEVVRKSQIPKSLRARFALDNLYVEDLPSFWRLLYTVTKHNGRRYVVIVRIVDHAEYSRWFPGKKR